MVRIIPSTIKTMHGRPAFIFGVASSDFDFGLAALNLAIRDQGCYLTEVIGRRETFSLLFGWILLSACGTSGTQAPELPQSISPGWTRLSYARAAAPSAVPASGAPECWRADYRGVAAAQTAAQVWVCRFKASGSAFDAVQRARAEAQTVKFQEGNYLVLVKWNDAPKASLAALVRAVQKATGPKP